MARKLLSRCTCQCDQTQGPEIPAPGSSPSPEPLTYSLAEAAQRIGGVTARSLADEFRAGLVSGYKIGRQWRMAEDDIRDYIDSRRVLPRQPGSAPRCDPGETSKPVQRQARKPKNPNVTAGDQFSLFG
ncbi:helix-turn-helix domain-containing protein [Mycolicibacterium brumae]|uniref:helix-turn-helix domain-containing protein n=1 Tax=Mycolicibacterium brumae TaxID=85968 RepID=UPI000FE191D0|nr:helix-turn-helix domain-containing protein [Mycolicibacterium brumae]MCV7193146.1 helix-turn-helix domain-containing protein [Mycolicibacterium brumae]RWA16525.1 hypothetical protein MBRU_07610 [Mycolicibacterium brumae DSM 44177]UWW09801.1 helix-turn-helix domain-containing protein [Mycolicibacterium brumae]